MELIGCPETSVLYQSALHNILEDDRIKGFIDQIGKNICLKSLLECLVEGVDE
jgi:hypothetical protein